jgi:hypothetical protein
MGRRQRNHFLVYRLTASQARSKPRDVYLCVKLGSHPVLSEGSCLFVRRASGTNGPESRLEKVRKRGTCLRFGGVRSENTGKKEEGEKAGVLPKENLLIVTVQQPNTTKGAFASLSLPRERTAASHQPFFPCIQARLPSESSERRHKTGSTKAWLGLSGASAQWATIGKRFIFVMRRA